MLVVGLLIRCCVGGLRIMLRNFILASGRNPDNWKFTRQEFWLPEVHPRTVTSFFMMVLTTLMWVFERQELMPALRRIKKSKSANEGEKDV